MGKNKVVGKAKASPPSPPRPIGGSYTRREIERFWRKKRLVEEEHLLAAIKAAARIKATHLSEEDYRLFLESLEEENIKEDEDVTWCKTDQEIRVGIRDWWTKSKYAYLNEPAVGTVKPSRRSNFKPNNMFFCNYKLLLLPSPVTTASAKPAYRNVY